MKPFPLFSLLMVVLLLIQSCSRPTLAVTAFDCTNHNMDPSANDTTQIIHELLLHTIAAQDVSDYQLIKNKKRIYVVNTLFKPLNSGQDTSAYHQFKNFNYLPYKIGDTRFCRKSVEELQALAHEQEDHFTALQIGHITINADTAVTGIRTVPLRSRRLSAKRVMLAGGGHHCKFQKVNGKWVYIGTVFGDWNS